MAKWIKSHWVGGLRRGWAGEDSQNETKTDRHDHCQFVGGIGGADKPVLDEIRKAIPKFNAPKIQKKKYEIRKDTHLKIEESTNRIFVLFLEDYLN